MRDVSSEPTESSTVFDATLEVCGCLAIWAAIVKHKPERFAFACVADQAGLMVGHAERNIACDAGVKSVVAAEKDVDVTDRRAG